MLEEVEEGWWKGSINGKIGVFPSNFVEEIEEDEVDNPAANVSSPPQPKPQEHPPGKLLNSLTDLPTH